ncbi:MAG: hypothetical protein JXA52_09875, partial [Planctomycetes bacterium]|nr:hypothetical protein [Planctomycetota bacterium]
MNFKRCIILVFLICLSGFLLAETKLCAQETGLTGKRIGLEDVLHPNTLLFVRGYDFSRLAKDMEGTALAKVAAHEEVALFLEELTLRRDELIDRVSEESQLDRETVAAFMEGQIAIAFRGLEPKLENLYIGISFPESPDRDKLFAMISAIGQKIINSSIPAQKTTEGDIQRLMLATPNENYFMLLDNLLVMTQNQEGLNDLIDRYLAGGKIPVLSSLDSYKRAASGSQAKPGSPFIYLNVRKALPALRTFTSPETVNFLDSLGMQSISDIGISAVFTGEGLRQTLYLHTPKERTGILKVLAFEQGITTRTKHLSNNFDSLLSARVNIMQFYQEVPRFIQACKDAMPSRSLRNSAATPGSPSAIGLDSLMGKDEILGVPVEEVLRPLGDSIIIQPCSAGTTICFNRADALAFEQVISRMEATLVKQGNGGAGEFTNLPEGDKVLRYYNQSGLPLPLAPSYVVLDENTILLSTHPQVLKAILRHSDEAAVTPAGIRDFDRVISGMPKDIGFLYYVNSKESYARVYDAILPFLNVITAYPALAADPGLLPPGNELSPFFFGTAVGISNSPDGMTLTAYS